MPSARLLAGVLILVVSTVCADGPGENPIPNADWRVKAKPSVIERGFSKKDVAQFVDNWRDVEVEDDPELSEALRLKPEQIDDFTWLDIDKDGGYELFVTYYENRTVAPSIYKSVNGKKSVLQHVSGMVGRSIDKALEDLNGDGIPEFIIQKSAAAGSSVLLGLNIPRPIWTAVYRWNGQKFEDASTSFKDFYLKRLLPQVKERLREIATLPRNYAQLTPEERVAFQTRQEVELATQWVIHDKILCFTGEDARAGINRAREWTKSPNRELRILAVDVFTDAGLGTYIADVQLLASDSDPYVSGYANMVLKASSGK
jgi:hypothetical protein